MHLLHFITYFDKRAIINSLVIRFWHFEMDGNVEDIDTKKYCLWCLLQLATKTKYDTDVPHRLIEQTSVIK